MNAVPPTLSSKTEITTNNNNTIARIENSIIVNPPLLKYIVYSIKERVFLANKKIEGPFMTPPSF